MTEFIGSCLIALSATIALAFIVIYHIKAAWWRTSDGRHVFAFMAVITSVLLLATLRNLVGPNMWLERLNLVVFGGVPIVLAWRLLILIQAQTKRTIRLGRGVRDRT